MSDFIDDDEDINCWLCKQWIQDDEPCTLVGYYTDDGRPEVGMVHDQCFIAALSGPDIMN